MGESRIGIQAQLSRSDNNIRTDQLDKTTFRGGALRGLLKKYLSIELPRCANRKDWQTRYFYIRLEDGKV